MSDAHLTGRPPAEPRAGFSLTGWRNRLVASRAFQSWASRFPLTRGIARREGEDLFELVSGFVRSQVLFALVALDIPRTLQAAPSTPQSLGLRHGIAPERMAILLQAGAAAGLLARRRAGTFGLSRRGAALIGVPGLQAMIRHHDVLYRDLADPVAFLRGETRPELAGVWPYVFGPGAEIEPGKARIYSELMSESQGLVAEETLRAVSLKGIARLLDVGGGTGVFLEAAADVNPNLTGILFDLPGVAEAAALRFSKAGLARRIDIVPGSFREDVLPRGADAVSLIRVLYDHEDHTVLRLLRSAYAALPAGGRVIVSEPMSGGTRPDPATDIYFAFYTLAMGTGRTRSAARICEMLGEAGFVRTRRHRTHRPFVTSVVSAVRPE